MVKVAEVQPPPSGEVCRGHLYTIPELCRRLRWSSTAFRTARRRGLAVRYVGGRGYVDGGMLIDFILEHGKPTK